MKCNYCGASLPFDGEKWKCDYCGIPFKEKPLPPLSRRELQEREIVIKAMIASVKPRSLLDRLIGR